VWRDVSIATLSFVHDDGSLQMAEEVYEVKHVDARQRQAEAC
jgi:hypothetical protein